MTIILENQSLRQYNTFAVDANARWFASFSSLPELSELLTKPVLVDQPRLVLGGGSNMLLTRDFSGLVLRNEILGLEKLKEDDRHVWIKIGAGENWHQLVLHAVEQGYGGIENLVLIPGSVGAAPIQNIGAYGMELQQTLQAVTAFDTQSLKPVSFTRDECQLGYRDSLFKHEPGRFIVMDVCLKLSKYPSYCLDYADVREELQRQSVSPNLQSISHAIMQIRQRKLPDPAKIPNSGSFFKNPIISTEHFQQLQSQYQLPGYDLGHSVKVPAAWLIEACGWKGKRLNNAGVHQHQALVLVNYGGATGEEILHLALAIKQDVFDKFSIELVPEVNII